MLERSFREVCLKYEVILAEEAGRKGVIPLMFHENTRMLPLLRRSRNLMLCLAQQQSVAVSGGGGADVSIHHGKSSLLCARMSTPSAVTSPRIEDSFRLSLYIRE